MEKLALTLKSLGMLSGIFALVEFFYQDMIWTALAVMSSLSFALGSNVWSILRVKKAEGKKRRKTRRKK